MRRTRNSVVAVPEPAVIPRCATTMEEKTPFTAKDLGRLYAARDIRRSGSG